jgi:V-type H+-transporting ATPase subunit a
MVEIRPQTGKESKKSTEIIQNLNDSVEENPLLQEDEYDMQAHMSLKAAHTLRASLEGREPEDFLKLVKEGLG